MEWRAGGAASGRFARTTADMSGTGTQGGEELSNWRPVGPNLSSAWWGGGCMPSHIQTVVGHGGGGPRQGPTPLGRKGGLGQDSSQEPENHFNQGKAQTSSGQRVHEA